MYPSTIITIIPTNPIPFLNNTKPESNALITGHAVYNFSDKLHIKHLPTN